MKITYISFKKFAKLVEQNAYQKTTWHIFITSLPNYTTKYLKTSGSSPLNTYILVFSIIANNSGLSSAHFMSQTSFLSNLGCASPSLGYCGE